MLGILTHSTIRRKILLLFVYHKEKEFYLSEVARRVGTSAGTAQRELNKLLAADFVIFKKKGNLSFYALNAGYSLLKEVETIIRKTYGIEVEIKNELGKIGGISLAFIFGSFARGNMKSDSDIDLFIVGRPEEDHVYRAVKAVEDRVGREINYHIAGEEEFNRKSRTRSFIRNIVEKPTMLLGTDDELEKLLAKA